jgi:hypothetical protein
MTRKISAQLVVWVLTAFFVYEMFHAPVRELLRRLAVAGDSFPP